MAEPRIVDKFDLEYITIVYSHDSQPMIQLVGKATFRNGIKIIKTLEPQPLRLERNR